MVSQRIFARYRGDVAARVMLVRSLCTVFRMKDGSEFRTVQRVRQFKIGKCEIIFLAEADNEDALPLLRYKRLGVYDLPMHLVAKFLEGPVDDLERPSLVMIDKILDVLQQESLRLVMLDDLGDIEKQGALCLIKKPVWTVKRVFLGYTGNRERLAGKSGQQQIMSGDALDRNLGDVAFHLMVAIEIGEVSDLGIFVPFACEDALAPFLKASPQPPDSCKQVNELEQLGLFRFLLLAQAHHPLQKLDSRLVGFAVSTFPAIDRAT